MFSQDQNQKPMVKDIYEVYKRYCLIQNSSPVGIEVLFKFILQEREKFPFSVKFVKNSENPFFRNLKLIPNPEIHLAITTLKTLEEKKQTHGLTENQEKALIGFKYLVNNPKIS